MTALSDLTWQDAGRLRSAILAVPLGATEQHGPHLPLSTDTDVAVALAGELARRRDDVLVGPAVPYGSSGEHADFPGTLSIGQQALELVLLELGRSASASFGRLLFVNGHGGNLEPLRQAVHRLRQEGHDVRTWSPRWRGDAHAGHTETSVQLALTPGRVRQDLAEAGTVGPLAELLPALRESGVRAMSANGVLGDPGGASAATGRALLSEAVEDLVALVVAWPPAVKLSQP